jgi:hypothetical protein
MIAASPSFMTNALAIGMDNNYRDGNDYRDSKGKDVSVKKIDCSNVNVNVNGFELNVLPPEIAGLASAQTQSADEARDSNGFGSGERNNGPSGHDKSGGVLCISKNNNNNAGAGGDDDDNGNGEDACADCFLRVLGPTLFAQLQAAITAGTIDVIVPGTNVEIQINSLAQLCTILDGLTGVQIIALLGLVFADANINITGLLPLLLLCLEIALDVDIDIIIPPIIGPGT